MDQPSEAARQTVGIDFHFHLTGTYAEIASRVGYLEELANTLGAVGVKSEIGLPEANSDLVETQLALPYDWLLSDLSEGSRSVPKSALQEEGLKNVRDILVIGSRILSRFDGIGTKAIESIKNNLGKEPPYLTFKGEPTIEDIAAICNSVEEIPLQAVIKGSLRNRRSVSFRNRRVTLRDALYSTPDFKALVSTQNIQQNALDFFSIFSGLKGWSEQ